MELKTKGNIMRDIPFTPLQMLGLLAASAALATAFPPASATEVMTFFPAGSVTNYIVVARCFTNPPPELETNAVRREDFENLPVEFENLPVNLVTNIGGMAAPAVRATNLDYEFATNPPGRLALPTNSQPGTMEWVTNHYEALFAEPAALRWSLADVRRQIQFEALAASGVASLGGVSAGYAAAKREDLRYLSAVRPELPRLRLRFGDRFWRPGTLCYSNGCAPWVEWNVGGEVVRAEAMKDAQ